MQNMRKRNCKSSSLSNFEDAQTANLFEEDVVKYENTTKQEIDREWLLSKDALPCANKVGKNH